MSYTLPNSAKPFTLNISEEDYSDFKQLLKASKIGPPSYENSQQDEQWCGVTHQWITETKDYWLNKFDWRAQEKHINSFPNYTMEVEDCNLHFVGLFSEKKDAIPIVFLHGWPGSFIEFLPLCELVQKKYKPADRPYHVIVPSLPGYTLSSNGGPKNKSWTLQDSARIIDTLMKNLGFEKYIGQGGDVGSFICTLLSSNFDSCVAVHFNMLGITEYPDDSELEDFELKAVEYSREWRKSGTAYAQEHGTRPNTISFVLNSNPLALLAWIGEKFLEWSDETPHIDHILTNISLYWFTSCFPSTMYPYMQIFSGDAPKPPPFLSKPTGFSFFPRELYPGIRKALEKKTNLIDWQRHDKGGHFAALEQPEVLLGDVEGFVKKVWKV